MYKKGLRIFCLILVLALITPTVASAQAQVLTQPQEFKADLQFFKEVLDYVVENYPFEVNRSDLIESAIKGMLQSLDPYSNYYTKEEAQSMYSDLLGTFSGIGAYLEEKDGYVSIVSVMKGQPAEKAGLQKGDLIISVDGVDIKGFGVDKVSSMIKGEKGTKVILGIKRGNQTLTIEVVRDTIIINPVYYEILEDNIGYIRLDSFNLYATSEVKKALDYFDSKNIKKIILDLRDNPGGLLSQAVAIARLFVPKGPIVYERRKNSSLTVYVSDLEKPKYDLVVLVNGYSASASEILAGAVKVTKAGKLVGTKTYGKGTVQTVITLIDGSILKLTVAEYLLPDKTSINGIGIEPDFIVENTDEDLQLMKAIELLK